PVFAVTYCEPEGCLVPRPIRRTQRSNLKWRDLGRDRRADSRQREDEPADSSGLHGITTPNFSKLKSLLNFFNSASISPFLSLPLMKTLIDLSFRIGCSAAKSFATNSTSAYLPSSLGCCINATIPGSGSLGDFLGIGAYCGRLGSVSVPEPT